MNRNKNIRNFTVIGICCYGIRLFWKPEIPNTISLVGGIIVAVIGLILIRVEQKTSNNEYYYGKNGGGLAPVVQVVNGAFILGISIALFTINALAGIVWYFANSFADQHGCIRERCEALCGGRLNSAQHFSL